MSKIFIRTFIKTNKYKSFYRHNFLIWENKEIIKQQLDNISIDQKSMIYVSNWYLLIELDTLSWFDNKQEHINFIHKYIKQEQINIWKTWYKNILNIIKKNKKKLWVRSIVEYVDEITLDYDSWLESLKDIKIDKLQELKVNSVIDLSTHKYLLDFIIKKSIKHKSKIWSMFIWFDNHCDYFLSILKNYNFLTIDKLFITKYIEGSNVKNFQITFKIKDKAMIKIMYKTLFNKISKWIFDKALKNASQLKIYKTWKNITRQFDFVWKQLNLKIKSYSFINNTNPSLDNYTKIKSISNISFKNIIIQNEINKISTKINTKNYKNIQYSLNNTLINDDAIKNIFNLIYFYQNYYYGILEQNIPLFSSKISKEISKLDSNIILELNKQILNINNKFSDNKSIKNIKFIQSFSILKENEKNKILLLRYILEKMKNINTLWNNNKFNNQIQIFFTNIIEIHKQYLKLLQYKYNLVNRNKNKIIKEYNNRFNLLRSYKSIKEKKQKKEINFDKKSIKILIWMVWNVFDKEDKNIFLDKIKKNKNIYYEYISNPNNNKELTLKYSYKKELSFNFLSNHLYKIFDNDKFNNFKIRKHTFIWIFIQLLENTEKKILWKIEKEIDYQNRNIFLKKKENIQEYIKYLKLLYNNKNMLYNNFKIVNFLKKHNYILEEIFNILTKVEWKVSKSLFIIQKHFFNLLDKKAIREKTKNTIWLKNKYKSNIKFSISQQKSFIKNNIVNTLKDSYFRHYYEWNRYKYITWCIYFLNNKIEYYKANHNEYAIDVVRNIISWIEWEINIDDYITEHGSNILEDLKQKIQI